MGRYAYFTAGDESIEYKFWLGLQDSDIPWAKECNTYTIPDYDEDDAKRYELTPEQIQTWKDNEQWEGDCDDWPEGLEWMIDCGYAFENFAAGDNDSNLEQYWQEVHALIKELNFSPFTYDPEKSAKSNWESYEDTECQAAYCAADKPEIHAEKQKSSDLSIKLLICCILAKHGSYHCTYEV